MPTFFRFRGRRIWRVALFVAGLASLAWGQQNQFVQRAGGMLTLGGSPFRFGGTNSYPLMLSNQQTVHQILQTVANSNLKVVRMWVFCDGVQCAGSSFFLQYLNTGTGAPAYNDDPNDGLANVDYAVTEAGTLGIKLIVTLTNNWTDYGGMDTYVKWHSSGPQYHDQFYTDPTIRQWYKSWISHVLNHVNTITGVAYKNDPAIMAWELSNEPECGGTGPPKGLPKSPNACTNNTIINWISDAAQYIKNLDSNHLVAVGDEGFFCEPGTTDYFTDCANGVDNKGFSAVKQIDLVGLHLYPDTWGKSIAWSETYITDHLSEATTLVKPLYMGEFGLLSGNAKEAVYNDWTNLIFNGGGSGAMFWDVLPGTPSPANAELASTFDEEAGSPVLPLMSDFAEMMAGSTQQLPPVAGYQWATAPLGELATLNVLSNDVAYGDNVTVDPTSINLDPGANAQQTTSAVNGGVFNVVSGAVQFTPQAGFTGTATGSYTVEDSNHLTSNVGYLFVTVNPAQTGWTTLDSFESATDAGAWSPLPQAAGTVALSPTANTEGKYSLQINVTAPGWFGVNLSPPANLSSFPSLAVDVTPTSVGGYAALAFQAGSNDEWCQNASWQPLALFSTTTLTIQLQPSQLQCYLNNVVVTTAPDLTSVHSVLVSLPSVGTYYLDNLRAGPAPSASAPLPVIAGIANSAGGQVGVSAGTYISIYGSNFAPTGWPATIWSDYVVSGQLPTKLAGVSVSIGGTPAYIEYVSPTQINILSPNLGTGSTSVTVTTPAGTSNAYSIQSSQVQPAFFAWQPGNYVVATDSNYNWLVKNGEFAGKTTAPAQPGETIILWGTGFGPTTPAAPAGQITPSNLYSVNGVVVTVGSVPVPASATALSPGSAGLYQVVITLPSGLTNGDYPIVATVGGVQSPSGVKLTVQQ
jgi:mannan endo-1,4-beta-mannosidase